MGDHRRRFNIVLHSVTAKQKKPYDVAPHPGKKKTISTRSKLACYRLCWYKVWGSSRFVLTSQGRRPTPHKFQAAAKNSTPDCRSFAGECASAPQPSLSQVDRVGGRRLRYRCTRAVGVGLVAGLFAGSRAVCPWHRAQCCIVCCTVFRTH